VRDRRWQRVPLELKDEGGPFMESETPDEALVTICDVLEGDAFHRISEI